jgi:hypothetical protein
MDVLAGKLFPFQQAIVRRLDKVSRDLLLPDGGRAIDFGRENRRSASQLR